MLKRLHRHLDEIIMIMTELLIAILLMLHLPLLIEIVTVHVGLLAMIAGAYCIRRYHLTTPEYLRYKPELYRGITLFFIGCAVASMQGWFSVTSSRPAFAFGLTLLVIAFFKIAVVYDARCNGIHALLFPFLSTLLTLFLSLLSIFGAFSAVFDLWRFLGMLMTAVLLIDAYEVYACETERREPWSMQIRCFM